MVNKRKKGAFKIRRFKFLIEIKTVHLILELILAQQPTIITLMKASKVLFLKDRLLLYKTLNLKFKDTSLVIMKYESTKRI